MITMQELKTDTQSLPEEFQHIIQLAQDIHNIKIVLLKPMVGGWSGAVIFLVSVMSKETGNVEHCILKLDHKHKSKKSDEVTRHKIVMTKAGPEFAAAHIADLVYDPIEQEGAIAIFYRIAGQSLFEYLPLSAFDQQSPLIDIFTKTNEILLSRWNKNLTFEQAVHPQKVLKKWLGFRLDAGRNIEHFLHNRCRINPEIPGFLISGHVFPNPLRYARDPDVWGNSRAIDIAAGFIHGDLNTNNILVKYSRTDKILEGYYLIDFALFKEGMPLLYDQRYLELSYLLLSTSQVSFAKFVKFLTLMASMDILEAEKSPIEIYGVNEIISSSRNAFATWVEKNHPSLHDDLWGQYWLAGVAAGLSYTHKAGLPEDQRLAGLIYAAANLKRYAKIFNLSLPTQVELLYDGNPIGEGSPGSILAKEPKHNIPPQPTRFIGRKEQITAIKKLLLREDVRQITMMGPGGTGKTRLSLQVAQEMLDQFPDGVYFIPLADDTDKNQLISRTAQQLQVREGGRPILENIKDFLKDKHLLLVMDNFEQLVSNAPVLADLLAAAPQIKIIITSRIALNLHGEHIFPVPPLNLPQTEDELTVDNLTKNESVMLFVDRAKAARPSFTLTRDNVTAVVEICRRLDGLPLALELSAARVKLLQPKAILSRLDERLKLLTGGARDLPTRHQTLRNTLMWSYDLLNQEEKILFARLSVFLSGFTFEAAEKVCNPDDNLDILAGLTSLVDNSLIYQEELSDGEPRFRMLETIREFAHEKLSESGELEILRQRHAKYFGDIAINRIGYEIFSSNALQWLDWLERELYNIRAALNWSLTTPGKIELGIKVVFALIWFWYRRGYFIEGLLWAERILTLPEMQESSPMRALALHSSGILSIWKGEQDKGLAQLQESLKILQRSEEDHWIAPTLISNAVAFINMGRDRSAQPLLEHAQRIFRETNQYYFLTIALVHLGNVELGLGNPQKALRLLEEAKSIAKTLDENWILSFVLNNLGEVARAEGQYDLAREYYETCKSLLSTTGDKGDIARFVHSLGYIAQHEEEFDLAESQFTTSLTMFRRLGNRRGIAESLAGLAGLKARQGHLKWGAVMLGAAETLLQSTGGAWWPADRVEVEQNRELIMSALDQNEFITAWKTGEAMTLDQAINFSSNASQIV
jgi:predicted ATPase